jgi:hypothetical protein
VGCSVGIGFKVVSVAAIFLAGISFSSAQDLLQEYGPEEAMDFANFSFVPRPNYQGSFWIVDSATNKIIGYARWSAQNRQWRLFNLKSEYKGLMQATIGTDNPPHYTQYAWYDKENRYKAAIVTRLGGRPRSPGQPFGELGGEFLPYEIGNIPLEYPSLEIETDPLRRFPSGVDVSPITPEPLRAK